MNRRRLVIGTVVLSLALAACGSSSKSTSTTGTTAAGGAKTFSGTITLAVNPWDGSAANAAGGPDNITAVLVEVVRA